MLTLLIFTAVLLPNIVKCGPVHSSDSLLIMGDQPSSADTPNEIRLPELKSMHVITNIRNRYARSIIETKYVNPENQAQEATFTITLPDKAFISGFVMEIDGKKYTAYVKEKEEAKKDYEEALKRGQSAGHVAMDARDSKTFTVSVNVEPLNKILFTLTYEQLLERKNGKYEMVINLKPGQLVDDFNVDVNINETRRITNVDTPALRSGNEIIEDTKVAKNPFATISKLNDDETEVNIHFSPSIEQQSDMMVGTKGVDEKKGISGQFVVEYDVERDPYGGEVIVDNGYFVHFFAPSDLEPIPKHIIFVLDVSGSMMGKKIQQLREAMKVILEELNPNDYFHLVKFSTGVQVWNDIWVNIANPKESDLPQPIAASKENIETVQKIVEKMKEEGMTNIYDALLIALRLASKGVNNYDNEIQPIIVFLTDGHANEGISSTDEIIKMVHSTNEEAKSAIFTLAFGDGLNKDLLKKIAPKNLGFMRQIYEASDASLQLKYFYREISSPLLSNVDFVYADDVSNVTKNKFNILFKGSELVVAGKLVNTYNKDKLVSVEAKTLNGSRKFVPTVLPIHPIITKPKVQKEYGSLERLWAYLTINQLLDKKYESSNEDKNLEKEALDIALKYSFVTPVSSLVVVKPNSTETSLERTNVGDYKSRRRDSSLAGRSTIVNRSFFSTARSRHMSNNLAGRIPILPSRTTFDSYPHDRMLTSYIRINPIQMVPPTPLLWMVYYEGNKIKIDGEKYLIGDNTTIVDNKPCHVNTINKSGNCTLINSCPKLYPTLDSLSTFKKYFCSLDSGRYAGVCCVDV